MAFDVCVVLEPPQTILKESLSKFEISVAGVLEHPQTILNESLSKFDFKFRSAVFLCTYTDYTQGFRTIVKQYSRKSNHCQPIHKEFLLEIQVVVAGVLEHP